MASEDDMRARLKALMDEQGLTERGLALRIGSNPTLIRDILTGASRNPRRDTIARIAAALGVSFEQLATGQVTAADEARLVEAFRRLSPRDRERELRHLEQLADDLELG